MTRNLEKSALEKLAKRYAADGFEVFLERDAQRVLPEDLRRFVPDMVVMRGDEKIVIELKQQGVSQDHLRSLAEQVKEHPNWRLDVLFVKSSEDPLVVSTDDVKSAIDKAERLFSADEQIAAFLLLWSAFEAGAMAALTRENNEVIDTSVASASLVKHLVFEGIIEEEDHDRLRDIIKIRNSAVHGGLTVPVERADFDFLMKISNDLISPFEPGSQAV